MKKICTCGCNTGKVAQIVKESCMDYKCEKHTKPAKITPRGAMPDMTICVCGEKLYICETCYDKGFSVCDHVKECCTGKLHHTINGIEKECKCGCRQPAKPSLREEILSILIGKLFIEQQSEAIMKVIKSTILECKPGKEVFSVLDTTMTEYLKIGINKGINSYHQNLLDKIQ